MRPGFLWLLLSSLCFAGEWGLALPLSFPQGVGIEGLYTRETDFEYKTSLRLSSAFYISSLECSHLVIENGWNQMHIGWGVSGIACRIWNHDNGLGYGPKIEMGWTRISIQGGVYNMKIAVPIADEWYWQSDRFWWTGISWQILGK